ncbi:MAG: hypothetical protein ABF479_16275 [Gluconacetobacter sp.]|uniref:Uncharacterized protein n=2 Tax=Acetobacter TaxID=434 RepID=A0A6S6PVY1_ACEAC|nr:MULTISPECIES: hypothetical protein [Acetobacter]OAG75484.1 hypothetical protein Amal_03343 [Acetobacter malorum]BCI68802.1 hypothetical protein AAJCM20276_34260 [Acetobacter aceti]
MSHFPLSDLIPPPDDLLHAAVELRALMALEGLLLLELLGGNPAAHDVLEGVVILHRDLEHRHEQLERMLAKSPDIHSAS